MSPYQDIDPTVKTVVTVKGKDFTSGSIQNGVYVVLMDEKIWKPGEYMNAKGDEGAITSAWVTPDQLEAGKGSFTVKLTIPENTLDRTHTYYIGTMAAHGLALSDRSLDHAEKITFKAIDYGSRCRLRSHEHEGRLGLHWRHPLSRLGDLARLRA